MPREHPENLDDVNAEKINGGLRSFVTKLSQDIEEEISERANLDQAVDRLDKLRYGVRRRKTRPWLNAANYSIPLIDSDINRLKASYVNLAFGISPVVTFEPFGPEDVEPARKREILYDWRVRTQVKLFKPYCYGVDQVLGSAGQTIFRTTWKFTTRKYNEQVDLNEFDDETQQAIFDPRVDDEMMFQIIQEELRIDLQFDENIKAIEQAVAKFRDGKTEFDIDLLEVDSDEPEVMALNPYKDLTIPLDTKELNDARFIDYHNIWKTPNELKISMRDNVYEEYSDHEVESWVNKSSSTKSMTNQFESDEKIQVHETCVWYDINNDGIEERCIVTWPDASPESILRFIELPYDHAMWPYVQVKRELTEDGFYSTRGLPSLSEDFQVGISTAVNQAVDNGTLLNMPERVARKGLISNPRNRKFVPGELTEVNGSPNDYETRQTTNASQPVLFQQAQYLKSWNDNRLGQQTSGLGAQTDLAGLGERGKKTKAEIDATLAIQGQAQSLDLQIFQQQFAVVHYQIDSLYYQYGSDSEEIAITGQKPVEVSRAEIQGRFNLVPNGRVDNLSAQARLQKLMFLYNISVDSPFVKQKELLSEIYKNADDRYAQLLLKTDEELAQEEQQQAAIAEELIGKEIQRTIGMKKIGDDLDIRKTALTTPITGKQYAPD